MGAGGQTEKYSPLLCLREHQADHRMFQFSNVGGGGPQDRGVICSDNDTMRHMGAGVTAQGGERWPTLFLSFKLIVPT